MTADGRQDTAGRRMNASDAEARLAQIVPRLERARDEWDAPLGASYARQIWDRAISEVRAVLDAAPVAATPPQGIDRDALVGLLGTFSGEAFGRGDIDYVDWADRILALVRPIEGVVLSPEEAATAAACVRAASQVAYMRDDLAALAARLEATQ